jgi:hypothetical protein
MNGEARGKLNDGGRGGGHCVVAGIIAQNWGRGGDREAERKEKGDQRERRPKRNVGGVREKERAHVNAEVLVTSVYCVQGAASK